ncbi:MAG: bifunctional 4-hydroxy-2-oxoglutarate aldolase/2-dehydro-3-deoxy-phosphogluconate aldolase [Planctomycetota bacterium]
MNRIHEQIEALRIIPVVAIENLDHAERLADTLSDGGLPCAEITLRTEAGIAAIERLSRRDGMLVGAGTVHSVQQAQQATEAGAEFIVSPGFNPKTVQWCLDNGVTIIPGTSNPSDLEMALEFGLDVVKFFPAEAMGGIKTLKAFHGPYHTMRFMPTGGVSPANIADYLSLPFVIACGGSWMVRSKMINEERFEEIEQLTREAMNLV